MIVEELHGFHVGDRVELVRTDDPWTDLRPGDRGTVNFLNDVSSLGLGTQIGVEWDNGSHLMMVIEAGDRITKVEDE